MINRTKSPPLSGLYFSGKLCYGTSNFLVCKKIGRKRRERLKWRGEKREIERDGERENIRARA